MGDPNDAESAILERPLLSFVGNSDLYWRASALFCDHGGIHGWKAEIRSFARGNGASGTRLLALGDHFPLYKLFFQFPLFNKFRTPARMMMVFSFAGKRRACRCWAFGSTEIAWNTSGGGTKRACHPRGSCTSMAAGTAGMIHATSFLRGAPEGADESISWAASLALTLPPSSQCSC